MCSINLSKYLQAVVLGLVFLLIFVLKISAAQESRAIVAQPIVDFPAVPADDWTKEEGTRLDVDDFDTSAASNAVVIFVEDGDVLTPEGRVRGTNFLRAYYVGGLGIEGLRSAVSFDEGLTWTKEPGLRLARDSARTSSIVQFDSGLRIYFEDGSSVSSATSLDGLDWTVDPGVRVSSAFDPAVITLPDGTVRMYFAREADGTRRILSATSINGLDWVEEAGVRIDVRDRPPEDPAAEVDLVANEHSVIRLPDGTLRMYYTGGVEDVDPARSRAILSAVSADGLNWVKEPGIRIDRGPEGSLDSTALGAPSVIPLSDGNFRMLYSGMDGSGLIRTLSAVAETTTPEDARRADLSITITDSPDPVTAGANLIYTVTVTNNGPDAATSVVVRGTLPPGVNFVSSLSSRGSCSGKSSVTCNLATLPRGGSANITIVVRPTIAGGFSSTASVSGKEADPNTANNTATAVTTVKDALRQACTISWDGDAGDGLWQTKENWTGNELPGPNDDVCIEGFSVTLSLGNHGIRSLTSDGSLTITRNATLEFSANSQINGSLTLGNVDPLFGGTLHGTVATAPEMTIAGALNWFGGALSGGGVINANGGITISGDFGKELRGPTLKNPGTATWDGMGDIAIGSAGSSQGRFNNTGTFTASNDKRFIPVGVAQGFFNTGTFNKLGGTGTTSFFNSVPFHNTGTVVVGSGALELRGGGTSTGSFDIAPGSRVRFTAGTYNLEGAILGGQGFGEVDGAIVVVTEMVEATNFELISQNSNLGGPGTLTVSQTFRWTGGTMSGTGVTSVNDSMEINSPAGVTLNQRKLINKGESSSWSGGNITMLNGALFSNEGVFSSIGNHSVLGIGSGGTFSNAGGFIAEDDGSCGSETTFSNLVSFNNTNRVIVAVCSWLTLAGGGTSTGRFVLEAILGVRFTGGTHSLNGATFVGSISNVFVDGGTVLVEGMVTASDLTFQVIRGTLGGSGTLTVENLRWRGGTISGSGEVNVEGDVGVDSLFIEGSATKTLIGRTLNNINGFARWDGTGDIEIGGGGVFNNAGNFGVRNDQSIFGIGAGGRFVNAGFLFKISDGTTFFGVRVDNTGRLSPGDGTLRFAQGLFNNAGGTISGRETLEGRIFNGGRVTPGESPGRLNIVGDYTQSASGVLEIEIAGTAAGQFDQLTVSDGANLGGTLNISLLDGFQPVVDDTFTILTYASAGGAFDTINGLTLPGGRSFEVDFGADRLTLITRGVSGLADVAVTMTHGPEIPMVGDELTYTVTVTNNGPDVATGVTMGDALPAGVTFVSATPTQGICTEAGGTVTCDLGGLDSLASATVEMIVTPTVAGTITNTVNVAADQADPERANNRATDITLVNPVDLAVTQADSPDPVTVGQDLTYAIITTNNGPNPATGVTLTDTLPGSVTFVSATPTQGSCFEAGGIVGCDLGDLAASANATVTIVVTPTVAEIITNTVSVAGNEPDPNPGNNAATENTTVNPPPGADVRAMGR